jgi:hypothetical protein
VKPPPNLNCKWESYRQRSPAGEESPRTNFSYLASLSAQEIVLASEASQTTTTGFSTQSLEGLDSLPAERLTEGQDSLAKDFMQPTRGIMLKSPTPPPSDLRANENTTWVPKYWNPCGKHLRFYKEIWIYAHPGQNQRSHRQRPM